METTTTTFYNEFPTAEQLTPVIQSLNKGILDKREQMDYRMQNYYNCIDDYSYGGICDQVASDEIYKLQKSLSTIKEQLEAGRPLQDTLTRSLLCDTETGDIVSSKIVNGRFGPCWVIEDPTGTRFVGVAKKESTYAKKGYTLKDEEITYEYYIAASGARKIQITGRKIVAGNYRSQNTYISNLSLYKLLAND